MIYKKGFSIKPKEIKPNGNVVFTDGTNNINPSESACLSYGYTYDKGVCMAFSQSKKIDKKFQNEKTSNIGINKVIQSSNSQVLGENNELNNNSNCLISGESNKIESQINNATVFGKMGIAGKAGEFVIGGGGSRAGLLQHSEFQISNQTTDATVTSLFVQGDSDAGTEGHIFPPSNSICIYELYLTVLCIGGDDGVAGHYKTEKHIGSILKENDNTQTLVSSSITAISSSGNTGTVALDVGAGDVGMVVNVTGAANRNLEWSATVHLYINKTLTEI